ncbi:hypothetical protein BRAO375_1220003 [Bradyrhizobium sp. ORS 375]|uniref:hypothetical protein n=1 Tax=Bradyrhizobium sp. (strain ORS 375) TaxID=566679 RepID=UPI00024079B8|nr:hypothetical protein [Bradyrhizobium sp. ORS 375]CCD90827.1 hypothetical protein BRAO375_1220003 [Bradyrhizobium sp. ORS 375]
MMNSALRRDGSPIAASEAQRDRWPVTKSAAVSDKLADTSPAADENAATDPARPWWQTAATADDAAMLSEPAAVADRSWQMLDPIVMPPPPPGELEFEPMIRFGAAVIALSCLAFLSVYMMRTPKIEAVAMTDATAASSSRNVAAAATWRSDDGLAPGNGTTHSTPPQAPRTTAAASPAPAAASQLSKDEIADMLTRGRDLIGAGDVASARLILTLVADAGDAEASLLLARTYDAAALSDLKAFGVAADQAKARAWYMKAAERGSLEARRHLQ